MQWETKQTNGKEMQNDKKNLNNTVASYIRTRDEAIFQRNACGCKRFERFVRLVVFVFNKLIVGQATTTRTKQKSRVDFHFSSLCRWQPFRLPHLQFTPLVINYLKNLIITNNSEANKCLCICVCMHCGLHANKSFVPKFMSRMWMFGGNNDFNDVGGSAKDTPKTNFLSGDNNNSVRSYKNKKRFQTRTEGLMRWWLMSIRDLRARARDLWMYAWWGCALRNHY